MRKTAVLRTSPVASYRPRIYDRSTDGRSIARIIKTYIATDTDIETYPDRRSARQKLYDASLFVMLGILVVPWLCIVGAMWLMLTLLGIGKPKSA